MLVAVVMKIFFNFRLNKSQWTRSFPILALRLPPAPPTAVTTTTTTIITTTTTTTNNKQQTTNKQQQQTTMCPNLDVARGGGVQATNGRERARSTKARQHYYFFSFPKIWQHPGGLSLTQRVKKPTRRSQSQDGIGGGYLTVVLGLNWDWWTSGVFYGRFITKLIISVLLASI